MEPNKSPAVFTSKEERLAYMREKWGSGSTAARNAAPNRSAATSPTDPLAELETPKSITRRDRETENEKATPARPGKLSEKPPVNGQVIDFGLLAESAAAVRLQYEMTKRQVAAQPPQDLTPPPALQQRDEPTGPVMRRRSRRLADVEMAQCDTLLLNGQLFCNLNDDAARTLYYFGEYRLTRLFADLQKITHGSAAETIRDYWDAAASALDRSWGPRTIYNMLEHITVMENFFSREEINDIAQKLNIPGAVDDGWQVLFMHWSENKHLFSKSSNPPTVDRVVWHFFQSYKAANEKLAHQLKKSKS